MTHSARGFEHAYGSRTRRHSASAARSPFVKAFADAYPQASILLTGASDPASGPHGPNESLHLGELRNQTLAQAVALRELA